MRETCYEQNSDVDYGLVTTNDAVWIRKIQKLAADRPDDLVIVHSPEGNYGYMLAKIPTSWFCIRPPKKVNFSNEQKEALRERMAIARMSKTRRENDDCI